MPISIIELIAKYLVFLYAIPLLAITLMGDWETAALATLAAGIAWYLSVVLKLVIRRPRPYIRQGKKALLDDPPTDFSFPSGHTSTSVGLSTGVLFAYPTLGIFLIAVGTLVGIARIRSKVHAIEDIVAGVLLGLGSGFIAYKSANLVSHYLTH